MFKIFLISTGNKATLNSIISLIKQINIPESTSQIVLFLYSQTPSHCTFLAEVKNISTTYFWKPLYSDPVSCRTSSGCYHSNIAQPAAMLTEWQFDYWCFPRVAVISVIGLLFEPGPCLINLAFHNATSRQISDVLFTTTVLLLSNSV